MSAKHVCVLDCQSEFNCCLFGLNIISSGSRATVVLQNKTKWDTQVFTHLFRTAIKCAIIAAFCIRAVFHQSPPPDTSYNSSLPILSLSFFFLFLFLFLLQSCWWKEQMVCSVAGVSSTESSVRSFTPPSFHPTPLGCGVARVRTLDCNTCQRLAVCKICHFWGSN